MNFIPCQQSPGTKNDPLKRRSFSWCLARKRASPVCRTVRHEVSQPQRRDELHVDCVREPGHAVAVVGLAPAAVVPERAAVAYFALAAVDVGHAADPACFCPAAAVAAVLGAWLVVRVAAFQAYLAFPACRAFRLVALASAFHLAGPAVRTENAEAPRSNNRAAVLIT